jgi:peptidoglycan L-alanyl-D-glutamate endopeptidase CwlK
MAAASEAGIRLVVTSGFRSFEEQDSSYEQGRTTPGPIVTQVRAGHSWHNYGLAFDVAVLDEHGRPRWPENAALWRRIGQLGEGVGLTWGGRFPTPDRPHFELRGGLSIGDVQRGARPAADERPDA